MSISALNSEQFTAVARAADNADLTVVAAMQYGTHGEFMCVLCTVDSRGIPTYQAHGGTLGRLGPLSLYAMLDKEDTHPQRYNDLERALKDFAWTLRGHDEPDADDERDYSREDDPVEAADAALGDDEQDHRADVDEGPDTAFQEIKCDKCGERLGAGAIAEVTNADLMRAGLGSNVVHAEPCATELLNQGWRIA